MDKNKKIKSKIAYLLKRSGIFISTMMIAHATFANPEGGIVTHGNASITQTPGNTQIQQSSQQAIIEWNSFNIGVQEKTQFVQPNSSAIVLNRINPTLGASQIYGQLTANGKIILVNQAGIFFGPTAHVDVAGLIASTANISNEHFLAGRFIFDEASTHHGAITNQGTLIAAQHGLIALIGTGVRNDGYIEAQLGNIILASGNKFTLDLYGDDLIHFSVDEAATHAGIDHNNQALSDGVDSSGALIADGGKILISAKSVKGVVDHTINMKGIAQAKSVSSRHGVIILSGNGKVKVSGKLIASGKRAGEHGGIIKVLAQDQVHLTNQALLDTSGYAGGGEILIGGNYQGKGPEINSETTIVDSNVKLIADGLTYGGGGTIIVWSDKATEFYGSASVHGGSEQGDGGFIETSGHWLDVNGAEVDLSAPFGDVGTWLLDPTDVYITTGSDTNITGTTPYQPTDGTLASSILNATTLTTALGSGNVTVTTTPGAGSGGSGNGDIFVNTDLSWNSAHTLTLNAARDINLNGIITNSGSGGLTLNPAGGGSGTVNLNLFINSGGAINLSSGTLLVNGNMQVASLSQLYAGNITLGGTTTISANELDLNATGNIIINGPINASILNNSSPFGYLSLSAANSTQSITLGPNSSINVNYFILKQGQWYQVSDPLPSFSSTQHFELYFGTQFIRALSGDGSSGTPYRLTDIYGVMGIGSGPTTLGYHYQLANDIDATPTEIITGDSKFNPIGNTLYPFTGSFDGENNKIDSVKIIVTSGCANGYYNDVCFTGSVGLFGNVGPTGVIQNLGLTNAFINGDSYQNDILTSTVGGLVGTLEGTLSNSYVSGNVILENSYQGALGGLVGINKGTITQSYNTATVLMTSDDWGNYLSVGGLVGHNDSTGTINQSFNSGSVTANLIINGTDAAVGGLVGLNSANSGSYGIYNSYNLGNISSSDETVSTPNPDTKQGGLVGNNDTSNAIIQNTYSTGYVASNASGTNYGGFIGATNGIGGLLNNYWNTETSGQSSGIYGTISSNVSGKTTAEMMQSATFSGWNFTTPWSIIAGNSFPYLNTIYTSTPRAISGISNAGINKSVAIAANGTNLITSGISFGTTLTAANGFYYFLEENGLIANGDAILTYLTNGSSGNAITMAPASNGSITGFGLNTNTVSVGDASTQTLTNTNALLTTAKGALTTLYTTSGSTDLTLNAGVHVASTASTTYHFDGNVTTNGGNMTFAGPLSLSENIILDTTHGGTTPTGASISLGAITSGGNALTLNAGTGGTITGSSYSGNGNLILSHSNGTSFSGAINATTVTLTNTIAGQLIAFNGGLTATTLNTANQGYNLQIYSGGTITNAVNFLNTGTVTLGNAGSMTFTGGYATTGNTSNPATTILNGTILSTGTAQNLGTTTLSGNSVLNSNNGNITLGTTNSNAAGTNTLTITAGSGSISLGTIGITNSLSAFTLSNTGATNDITIANSIRTANNIAITAGRNIVLSTGNLISLLGDVSLTATAGSISETTSSTINGGLLTTQSVTGTSLTNANTVTSFNATNTTSGNIDLTSSASTLTITGLTDNMASSSSVNITNTHASGDINLTGALNAGTNNVTLTANNGALSQNASGFITAGLLTTSSKAGALLNSATNAVSNFTATNTTSGNISLTNNIAILTIANADMSNTGSGGINITNSGDITVNQNINANTGAINLTASGTNKLLTISSAKTVSTSSASGITYEADNMTLSGATSASGSLVSLRPNSSTQLIGLGSADANGTLGLTNSELSSITASILNIGQASSGAISINASITSPTTTLNFINGTGGVSQSNSTNLIGTHLSINTSGTVSLGQGTGQNNIVVTLAAIINGATTNPFYFTNNPASTATLTIGSVNGINGITTSAGNGAISLTNSNGALAINQALNSGTGTISLTSSTQITQNSSGIITGGVLITNAATGILLNSATNVASSFTATNTSSDNINLTNAVGTLTIAGINQSSGNISVSNSGAINTSTAAITTAANGTIALTATGSTLTLGSALTAGGAGTITLAATGTNSDILLNATASSTSGNVAATAGRHITLNAGNIATTGNIILTADGIISEASTGIMSGNTLTAKTLNNLGGSIALNNAGNEFATIDLRTRNAADNADVAGAITYRDMSGFSITAINTTNTLSLTSGGAITQSGAIIADTLIPTATGAITLDNAGNDINNLDIVSRGGAFTLKNTGDLTLVGSISAGTNTNSITIVTTGGLVLSNGINLIANTTGDSIVLAGTSFTNNANSSVLNTGTGRFLVWSGNPTSDTRGGLTYQFKQYNARYGVTNVQSSTAGSGFLYTTAPTISPALIGSVSKAYDGTNVATLTNANYTSSGTINNDTVTLNNPTTGVYDNQNVGTNKNVSVSNLGITTVTDGSAVVYGYSLVTTVNANIGEITPAPLTVRANDAITSYTGTPYYGGNGVTYSGFLGLDDASALSGSIVNGGTSQGAIDVGVYSIIPSGLASINYTISYLDGLLTINSAPILTAITTIAPLQPKNTIIVATYTTELAANPINIPTTNPPTMGNHLVIRDMFSKPTLNVLINSNNILSINSPKTSLAPTTLNRAIELDNSHLPDINLNYIKPTSKRVNPNFHYDEMNLQLNLERDEDDLYHIYLKTNEALTVNFSPAKNL